MESKTRATAAGVFVIVMIAIAICTVLLFSQNRTVRIPYEIVTDRSVNGISPQASVELYGINVGAVESVSFVGGTSAEVRIRMMIDENAPINEATYATLSSRGVTGAVFVNLMDDTDVRSQDQHRLLTEVVPQGEPRLIPLRLSTLESFADSAADFFTKADETLQSFNQLLSPENTEVVITTIGNFGRAAQDIATLAATLDANSKTVLYEVSSAARQAQETLASVNQLVVNSNLLVENLNKPDGALQNITQGTESLAAAATHLRLITLPQVDSAAQRVSTTLSAGRRLLEELEAHPQMLLLGVGHRPAGPGEEGYVSPYNARE